MSNTNSTTTTATPPQTKVYSFKARSEDGRLITGKTKAPSQERVIEFLVSRNYAPLAVQELSVLQRDFNLGERRVKPKEVASFMRQLATMIGAGLPLSRALAAMRDNQANATLRSALTRVGNDLETGNSFGFGIEKFPKIFSPIAIAMVKAGEAGGFLDTTLSQVATNMEASVKLNNKIRSAMTYPVVVFILAILIVVAMLIFIVPVFANLYKQLGGNLPFATQVLVNISNFLKFGGVPLVAVVIVLIVVWRANRHKLGWRSFIDPIILKIPIFGKLIKLLVNARFARNFGNLLSAGLPVMQVMDIVGGTSGSVVMEQALDKVKARVATGSLIAPQLAQHDIFPRMLTEMMAVGEEAGDVPIMMEKIAEAYDDEVNTMADQLSSLIEPLMLVVLGAMVGAVVISLYLPIFNIYSLIQNQQ